MSETEPEVTVRGGRIRGRTEAGISAFLGIPYAAPAIGAARFELPRPAPSWDGVRPAQHLGPACVQSPYPGPIRALLGESPVIGDDYLNLNVWTPDPGGSGLPVMVWIHGGAFTRGANSLPLYEGSAFARDGVVLVSINYRLGISGFAVLPDAPMNRGLHDQLLALQWVQDNIAAFGGDPGRVTIFGESAGAMSVGSLLASPLSAGLFERAIMQSGNGSAVADPADAAQVTAAIAEFLGIGATAAEFAAVEPSRLQSAQDAIGLALTLEPDPQRWGASVIASGLGVMSLFPVADGEVLPGPQADTLVARPERIRPLLIGNTSEEFRFFTVPAGLAAAMAATALSALLARSGIDPDVAKIYFAARPDATPGDIYSAIITDVAFRTDTMRIADIVSSAGTACHVYEFGWPSGIDGIGSCHALEIPFVFDTLALGKTLTGPNPPQPLADEMHRAWVDFAVHGDPGWARYESAAPLVRHFGSPASSTGAPRALDELDALHAAFRH
ncbi:carboxylesterase/lipase family protein [Nocardia sp. NPDC020380]|uniref:carboxylesterase/lipase family protein n=1 Tax=Nocardia sp. NPDC020380 TaxID=3364309 RepID=UPI0037A3188F